MASLKTPKKPNDFTVPLLKEDSPVTKTFKNESRKLLNKGRTFIDEDEDQRLQNKLLKYKLDRQSKELQEMKYQLKINQEVSAALRVSVLDPTENEYTLERAGVELLNSSYYSVFLSKVKSSITNENNFMSLIQNEGVLLRTHSLEITFKNTLFPDENGNYWLKYDISITNLEDGLLENVWLVYKEPRNIFFLIIPYFFLKLELLNNLFPEISCLNMVSDQTILQEVTLGLRNLFLIPMVFDISFRFLIFSSIT